jgi:outer membrane protein assembly factor BamB
MTPDEFPADTHTLSLLPADFSLEGKKVLRFKLMNAHDSASLHIKLSCSADWLSFAPQETVLGPKEQQTVVVIIDVPQARKQVLTGTAPSIPLTLTSQRLLSGGPQLLGPAAVYVRLPVVVCPSCEKMLDANLTDGIQIPEICPACFERLRPCPICGTPNSWIARVCAADPTHLVRTNTDWPMLGGSVGHEGARSDMTNVATLTRRWSYPNVPPTRAEQSLSWSAPVSAHGIVAAAAATADGEAHLYAFEVKSGAPLWEPYPLPDPVYPERGGAAITGGKLIAATVEGVLVAVDLIRGTRLWEKSLPGRVYGSVVVTTDGSLILVPLMTGRTGALAQVDAETGELVALTTLSGPPDTAPAADDERAYIQDDGGTLTAVLLRDREILWTAEGARGFNSAPLIADNRVFAAAEDGVVRCYEAPSGWLIWEATLTNAGLSGTPATDGGLLVVPADDGLHFVSTSGGRSVRRYQTHRPLRSAPILLGGTVFFGGTDGIIYSATAGRALESLYEVGGIGAQLVAAPAFSDNTLFIAATNGVLYALTVG